MINIKKVLEVPSTDISKYPGKLCAIAKNISNCICIHISMTHTREKEIYSIIKLWIHKDFQKIYYTLFVALLSIKTFSVML